MNDKAVCKLCGDPMPEGEEMFFYHGYSGPCPKPPLPKPSSVEDGYLGWAVYKNTNGVTTLHFCDSDTPKAFKVYRHPEGAQ